MRRTLLGAVAAVSVSVVAVCADEAQPYAGLEQREISSLSGADVQDLIAGRGWGLALPAELNGWPGPRHVLDLSEELALSPQQISEIQAVFDAMKQEAQALGGELIRAELALDQAFRENAVDAEKLTALLAEAEAARRELRKAHLRAHMATKPVLTDAQQHSYDRLRGYSGDGAASHGGHGAHHHTH